MVTCLPVSGNDSSWSNFAGFHAAPVWHVLHVSGNATWSGTALALSAAWQPMQSLGCGFARPALWQALHPAITWASRRGKTRS